MIFVAFLVVAVAVVEGSGTACVRGTRNGMVRMRLMRLLCGQERRVMAYAVAGALLPCMELFMPRMMYYGTSRHLSSTRYEYSSTLCEYSSTRCQYSSTRCQYRNRHTSVPDMLQLEWMHINVGDVPARSPS